MTGEKASILFLCTGNSCRSQMAEAFANRLRGDKVKAHSAGVEKHGLNPLAVQAMAEVGIDISAAESKRVDSILHADLDYVVTLCGHAHETCPVFLGKATKVHVGFDDPPALARDAASEEEALSHYRRVRDEIRAFVEKLPGNLRSFT